VSVPRPEHAPIGDPCEKCGLGAKNHRKRDRAADVKAWRAKQPKKKKKKAPPTIPRERKERLVLGLDGEGYTTRAGEHLYTFLAACSSDGAFSESVANPRGLEAKEILGFFLSLPPNALKVGFSLGYDVTKWIEGLKNRDVYELVRPELRPGKHGPRPLKILLGGDLYGIGLVAGRFTVSGPNERGRRTRRTATVWDLFRFYQRSFVASLREWKVGTEDELAKIQKMKDARGTFEEIGEREEEYCRSECRLLARLAERLIEATDDAGIPLRDFYGAGSLGAATLREGPAKKQKARIPKKMRDAVARAFFGGRFEQSARGPIDEAHGYDLASAYPYAETTLPCLQHGKWRNIKISKKRWYMPERIRRAKAACVRYVLPPRSDWVTVPFLEVCESGTAAFAMPEVSDSARVSPGAWGPFPFRLEDGGTLFPTESGGGWLWREEIRAALEAPKLWPNLVLREAWILEGDCDCPARPLKEEIVRFYLARLSWGKDARGIVLKKGLAARYGKRAQTVGSAPYHCAVAAGMITSHCRAELLRAIARAPSSWDVLSIATDGILSRRELVLREPEDTGTAPHGKALGSWEHKPCAGGVFLLRPGMRFARDLSNDEGTTAARGVGVTKLHAERASIMNAWEKKPAMPTKVPRASVFHGAKLSVAAIAIKLPKARIEEFSERDERVVTGIDPELVPLFLKIRRGLRGSPSERREKLLEYAHENPDEAMAAVQEETERELARMTFQPGELEYRRRKEYGRWTKAEPFKVSYSPLPKRPVATRDHRFLTWALGPEDGESAPYDPIAHRLRGDVLALRQAQDEAEAQPDQDDGPIGNA
jgi:hypothetical protein